MFLTLSEIGEVAQFRLEWVAQSYLERVAQSYLEWVAQFYWNTQPDYNAEEDNALIASFQTEMEQWERFNSTGLHEDLPADAGERLRNHLKVFPKKRVA